MKKLTSFLSVFALACGAVSAHAQDDICNGNGTLIDANYWDGEPYLFCELPTDIATGGTYELEKYSQVFHAPILWVLPEVVTVGNGHLQGANPATVDNTIMVIEAGARVVGAKEDAALVITRGAQLVVAGTLSDPVIFSSLDEGYSGKGEWGGVILSGFGVSNGCDYGSRFCFMEGIFDDYYYGGGADTTHSSGYLNYVVITEGGFAIDLDTDDDPDPNSNGGDEINGLTLYAVNKSTTLNNIHVHDNLDDGIQFFGGDVNATNLWLTCNQDDSLEWDTGYQGDIVNVQIVQQSEADHAFELGSESWWGGEFPVSNGTIINASLTLTDGYADTPFRLKTGTHGIFDNIVIRGYSNVWACGDNYTAGSPIFGSLVSYDCYNANDVLPANNPTATGFSQPSFWTAAQGNPGCD